MHSGGFVEDKECFFLYASYVGPFNYLCKSSVVGTDSVADNCDIFTVLKETVPYACPTFCTAVVNN